MTERFELTETFDIRDNLTEVIYPVDIIRNHPKQICALLNDLYNKNQELTKENIHLDARRMDLETRIRRLYKND